MAVRPSVDPSPFIAAADQVAGGELTIFGRRYPYHPPQWNRDPETGRLAPLQFSANLNYRDENLVGNIKTLWEPNRHLHLATLAQAFSLTGHARYLDVLGEHLESWLEQNPYRRGPNWTSSLEAAIRLINWSFVWYLTGGADSPLVQGELRTRWLESIYQHCRFIRKNTSRYSSANNHLIGELTGLYIGSWCWPFWPEAEEWRGFAKRELSREALLQNAPDGVNREQSVAYTQFVLEFLLTAGLCGRVNRDDFGPDYWRRVEAMMGFLAALTDSKGKVPMIGDADDGYLLELNYLAGVAPHLSLLATGAVLFGRADLKALSAGFDAKSQWLLGDEGSEVFEQLSHAPANPCRTFPDGGLYLLGKSFYEPDEVRLWADAGPLGYLAIAAHGHCDALALILSVAGEELLIDPGTYAYHPERLWRDYFRGTSAHNTVRIDGMDQSQSGGSFMWVSKAQATCEVWEPGESIDHWVASHDGYRRLPDPVLHRREITLDKSECNITVIDTLICKGRHLIERFWHFSEECEVTRLNGCVRAAQRSARLDLTVDEESTLILCSGQQNPPAGWVSRKFGHKQPTTTLVVKNSIEGTTTLRTTLRWSRVNET